MFKKVNNLYLSFLILITSVLSIILIQNTVLAVWEGPTGTPGIITPNILTNPVQENLDMKNFTILNSQSASSHVNFSNSIDTTGSYYINNNEVLGWNNGVVVIPGFDGFLEYPLTHDFDLGNSYNITASGNRNINFNQAIDTEGYYINNTEVIKEYNDSVIVPNNFSVGDWSNDTRFNVTIDNSDGGNKVLYVDSSYTDEGINAIYARTSNTSNFAAIVGVGSYGVQGYGNIGVWASGLTSGMSIVDPEDPNNMQDDVTKLFDTKSASAYTLDIGSMGSVVKGGYKVVKNESGHIVDIEEAGTGLCALSGKEAALYDDGSDNIFTYCSSSNINNYAGFFGGDIYQKGMFQVHYETEAADENLIYANAGRYSDASSHLLKLQTHSTDKLTVDLNGSVHAYGSLEVNGATILNSDVNINGSTTIKDNLFVEDNLFVYGWISATDTIQTLGYIKIKSTDPPPNAQSCDNDSERGRMVYGYTSGRFYICDGRSGWRYINTQAVEG